MGKLRELPNISKVCESKLIKAGITDKETLEFLGSREAYMRIRLEDSSACICMLYALEGAIRGIRWHNLPTETKEELRRFYRAL